jgi:lipoprotein-anchoring transpeptidase ErfK/SrfK
MAISLSPANASTRAAVQPMRVAAMPKTYIQALPEFVRALPQAQADERDETALVVEIPYALSITSKPGGGSVVGTMPSYAKFGARMVAWVQELSKSGRYGKVTVPYTMNPKATGWIKVAGLKKTHIKYSILVDLSKHQLTLSKLGHPVMRVPAATGAPSTRTPPGRYHVADRWTSNPAGSLGAFVFALSGLQVNYPGASSGLYIMAIHGTNNPSTLGQSVSAGCVRVGAKAVQRLIPILRVGTPVVIQP